MRRARAFRPVAALVGAAVLVTVSACTSVETGRGSVASSRAPATPSSSSPGSSPAPATPTQGKAEFTDCKDQLGLRSGAWPAARFDRLSFDCATIQVPLDYAKPAGPRIGLQLLRIHDSRNTRSDGSLLLNPGGPGASGLEFALSDSVQLSQQVLDHYDLLGFDPRGVGASTPVRCLTNSQEDARAAASPDMRTAAGVAQAKAAAKMFAQACLAKYGSALDDFDTVQTARDLDQIRQAVGDPRLNYFGASYGTELGAQYAHLFPDKINVMVLDGAVDPVEDDLKAATEQLRGFENSFDQFAVWCHKHTPCSSLADPRETVYDIAATARRSPIPSATSGETRKATANLVLTGVLYALYSQRLWPSLGTALIQGARGDSQGLLQLADGYNDRLAGGAYTNEQDAFNAISCNDSKPGPTDAVVRATAEAWIKDFPMFGLVNAPSLFSCQAWQPKRSVPPRPTAPTASRTILVLGNLHDPATPYQGAIDLARVLGKARLLSWNGAGHTSYEQGSSCVDDYVNAYLLSHTLPPAGKVCR
ncbi:alpha/beta hydrolase [uncultured Jatrophihabitans sp.]|uniref:alpha/beta hydrolase n=1 Tax=uncultured Jatrophihabitans sp. TaxID=1610747 RepID=UPI0035C9D25C